MNAQGRRRPNAKVPAEDGASGRKGPDKYFDEHGLILRVRSSGSKHWIWRGTVRGRRRDLGLGTFPYVWLGEAREKVFEYRRLAKAGEDPAAVHLPEGTTEVEPKSNAPTFRKAAAAVIDLHRPTWRNPKSAAQWEASLRDYAYPVLGDMGVDEIGSGDVLRVLRPIWNAKRETAQRVRQHLSAVMKAAIAAGHRPDNPAGDALTATLPKGGQKQRHQRALPHRKVAAALETVRRSNAQTSTKLAFEFLVLTAARSGEVRLMNWDEVNTEDGLWTVPASRMKAGRQHRVPLSGRAAEVLAEAEEVRENDLVFPSATGRRMSDNTLSKLLRDLGIDAVPHGFRASFRDWCAESGQLRELAEAALAHTIRNKAEAAYARTDLVECRRELMEAWAGYLARGGASGAKWEGPWVQGTRKAAGVRFPWRAVARGISRKRVSWTFPRLPYDARQLAAVGVPPLVVELAGLPPPSGWRRRRIESASFGGTSRSPRGWFPPRRFGSCGRSQCLGGA